MSTERSRHVVVDVGKSATRLRRQYDGQTVGGPGAPPELAGSPQAGAVLAELIASTWADSPDGQLVDRVTIGSTFRPDPAGIATTTALLAEIWPAAQIAVFADGVLAHAAALGGPGSVVSIGTGVTVVGADASGELFQRDSWGPDLGDRGSAAELGREGLRLACATIDGVADAPALLAAARKWTGGQLDIGTAIELLARPDRVGRIAEFAQLVCELAADGDGPATELVERAAAEVAASCAALARRIDDPHLVVLGRLPTAPGYASALQTRLAASGLEVHPPRTEVLDVAPEVIAAPGYQRWAGRSPLPG